MTATEHAEDPEAMRQALLDAIGLRDCTHDAEQYTRVLYIFLIILHRRNADEHQDLLRILTEEHTQNQEVVNMAASIIELSEQRGLQQGIKQGIEQGLEQGLEQGQRRASIESTLAILNTRFPEAETDTLTSALEAIEDINRLKQLNIEASVTDSFHVFQEQVDAISGR